MTFSTTPANSPVHLRTGGFGTTFLMGVACFALSGLQVVLGGDPAPSTMLSAAVFFGLLAVQEAGAFTAIGTLNFLLVGRVLLGAFVAKNLMLSQPITANMLDAESTAPVMMFGFMAVWLATLITRRFVPAVPWFKRYLELSHLRSILIVLLCSSLISAVAVRFNSGGDEALAGGIWGIAKALNSVRNLSLPILMLYLWRIGCPRWLTHPATLGLAAALFIVGVLSTSKQAMAEPIAFYIFMAIARYGWRHPVGWIVVPVGIAVFQLFIYPVSQYARNAGGAYKDPVQAAVAMGDIVGAYVMEPSFREYVRQYATSSGHWDDGTSYLPEKLVAMGRVALVGEADRLISSSNVYQFTDWETITNSLLLAVPHFLLPNKPQAGSGNYLARYTGDLPASDISTQVSYGFMANAYNAFGLSAVLPLSLITALLVLVPIALISSGKIFESPWAMFGVVSIHQTYTESSFSGLFGAFNIVVLAGIVYFCVRMVDWLSQHYAVGSRSAKSKVPNSGRPPSTLTTGFRGPN